MSSESETNQDGMMPSKHTREAASELDQLLRDEVDKLIAEPSEDDVAALAKLRRMRGGIVKTLNRVQSELFYRSLDDRIDAIADRMLAEAAASRPGATLRELLAGIEGKHSSKLIAERLKVWKEQRITDVIGAARCSWNTTLTRTDELGQWIDERIIELPLALEVCQCGRPGRVLDAGCALNHRFIRALIDPPVASLVHFTQSGEREEARFAGDKVSYMFGDLRAMPFPDDHFDRIVCISTLEHVGMDNERYGGQAEHDADSSLQAVRDLMRVLKSGGTLLLTVPYGPPADLGWFRVFGPTDIGAVVEAARATAADARYYRLEGTWVSSSADVADLPPATGDHDETSGLAALRLVK